MEKRSLSVTLFGDSIAAGLGVSDRSYANVLSTRIGEQLGVRVELQDLSGTAKMISESYENLDECTLFSPDFVLVAHGVTESVVRPYPRHLKYMPRRWRKPGWMDPRPFFSSRPTRLMYQKLESALRWRVKVALIKWLGGSEWMPLEHFEAQMQDFVDALLKRTKCHVLIVPPFAIDENYFPRTSDNFRRCRKMLSDLADEAGERVHYFDIQDVCRAWGDYFDDHFHPNASGHSRIAEALCSRMSEAGLLDRVSEEGSVP